MRLSGIAGVIRGGVAGLMIGLSPGAALAGPFSSYAGSWTGVGTVSVDSGARERLRCRAHYLVGPGGLSMEQTLTCASDSYKFNIIAKVRADGSSLSGTWSETTRGVDGDLTGRIGPKQISAQVNGVGFSARIGIAARDGRQSVTIIPTGSDISNVSLTMSRN